MDLAGERAHHHRGWRRQPAGGAGRPARAGAARARLPAPARHRAPRPQARERPRRGRPGEGARLRPLDLHATC